MTPGRFNVYCYTIAGLSVESELALPGMVEGGGAATHYDVRIFRHDVPLTLEGVNTQGPIWQIAGEQFLMRIPDVARFLLTAGKEIRFEPEGSTQLDEIPIFIIGTVFGILLHQREEIVLHASAVRVGDKAVVFCGASGAGKSTLAAALVQRGYPLVADDLCATTLDGKGKPIVKPAGRQLKLWTQAIENLDLAQNRDKRVRKNLEKFYVTLDQVADSSLPLGAVYILREALPSLEPGISRPNIVDAAVLLRKSAYRPMLVKLMQQKESYFQASARIANAVSVCLLTRALDFSGMPTVVSWLEAHWVEIGLGRSSS